MKDKVIGREVGPKVCEALGINVTGVRSVVIRIMLNDAVTVTVERFIEMGPLEKASMELVNEQYELQHRGTTLVETL